MRFLVAGAGLLMLCGCAEVPIASSESLPGYRSIIIKDRATLFSNYESIKEASIGKPKPNVLGWEVCLRAKLKEPPGLQEGLTTYRIQLYRDGSAPLLQLASVLDVCSADHYEPFPEIEAGYIAPSVVATPSPVNRTSERTVKHPSSLTATTSTAQ